MHTNTNDSLDPNYAPTMGGVTIPCTYCDRIFKGTLGVATSDYNHHLDVIHTDAEPINPE